MDILIWSCLITIIGSIIINIIQLVYKNNLDKKIIKLQGVIEKNNTILNSFTKYGSIHFEAKIEAVKTLWKIVAKIDDLCSKAVYFYNVVEKDDLDTSNEFRDSIFKEVDPKEFFRLHSKCMYEGFRCIIFVDSELWQCVNTFGEFMGRLNHILMYFSKVQDWRDDKLIINMIKNYMTDDEMIKLINNDNCSPLFVKERLINKIKEKCEKEIGTEKQISKDLKGFSNMTNMEHLRQYYPHKNLKITK